MAVSPAVVVQVVAPSELRLGIDGPSVERAIANLVDNATRFSPRGAPVIIEVSSGPQGVGGRVAVTDQGPGIAEEDQRHIFDRYYRGQESEDDAGRGIGLAIVKQVADAHGSVEVASPVGDGRGTRIAMVFENADALRKE